ncbi:MAG: TldD/PmbA family protein [Aestuariivirga sp.]
MSDELLNLAQMAVDKAIKLGATAADAIVVDGNSTSVSVRQGKIEDVGRSESRDIGIRVFAGQSSAIIAGSVLTSEAIGKLVERALAMAKLAPPDPYSGIADPSQLAQKVIDLDLVGDETPSPLKLQEIAFEAEAVALSIPGVSKSNGAGSSESSNSVAIAASNGFAQAYRRTGYGFSASVIAGEGTTMERDYDGTSALHFSDLETPEKIGRSAGERAVKRLNPRKLASQTVPVIFDRRVSSSLIGHLAGAINGASIARGVSFLKDDMGKALFKSEVTIVDDPLRIRGFSSRSFDGEGLPTERRNLIDKGVLTSWVLDLRSARQLGLSPTGSGARGLGSQPGPSTSNLHMEPGTKSPEDMMRDIGTGLLVTEFIGSSINSATGDYSRGATGFWIENGEIQYPVSEITIAGNLKTMFAALTPANDLIFKGAVNAPSCLIESMTIAGR